MAPRRETVSRRAHGGKIWHTRHMASKYWTGAHTKHRLRYHLVWIPKYRKRVLHGEVARRIRTLLYEACEVNQWYIHELAVQSDHVHCYIQLPPSLSVARAVQLMKGGTSRVIRQEFPELTEFLWGDSFWADGYFAESAGVVTDAVIRRYIQNQTESLPPQGRIPGL